jgi:hypothetical protein
LFQKSKLVDLDGYLFNPFEINNLSNELSMMPTFKYKLESIFDDYRVSVRNTILFCPNKSLYDMVMSMIEKGIRETQIRKILIGQRIKLNYPGWYRYFKITRFIEGETLENHHTTIDGRKVKLYDYFTQKYPYLDVKHKNQFLIEVETISERYRENLAREKHVLIPEFVNCLLTQDSF